ncbi:MULTISPECIES: hypothetical protein [Capnocytophaga]|uniref:Uncharacterized protein n=2 Tax=Capnocytophaga TaxID=1016 RepID=F9YTA4_CAPCC|nr:MULTISPECIES: hypothetical protein [Capnocytophaga]AEK24023.1 Conserved hypothetical protein [Capnocytophaga canimorsus Cc5]RIY35946.1 hypothetical protein CKY20_08790 [Capnocytophaga canis]WGU68584.1 hypothetical protein QIU19_00740 [Capnocytophaga canimorsus]WGU70308.1 hypothetical protein QIU18_12815 [Capnocytophaga canimorsus]CEN49076.1 conserved hypothetical protein [Capnocytophaga canimorsus]
MENKEITFEVMVTSSDLLEREIDRYNNFNNTDFKIIKITEEIEVFFCEIRTTSSLSHIFDLGFGLARYEEELRQQGKIDW